MKRAVGHAFGIDKDATVGSKSLFDEDVGATADATDAREGPEEATAAAGAVSGEVSPEKTEEKTDETKDGATEKAQEPAKENQHDSVEMTAKDAGVDAPGVATKEASEGPAESKKKKAVIDLDDETVGTAGTFSSKKSVAKAVAKYIARITGAGKKKKKKQASDGSEEEESVGTYQVEDISVDTAALLEALADARAKVLNEAGFDDKSKGSKTQEKTEKELEAKNSDANDAGAKPDDKEVAKPEVNPKEEAFGLSRELSKAASAEISVRSSASSTAFEVPRLSELMNYRKMVLSGLGVESKDDDNAEKVPEPTAPVQPKEPESRDEAATPKEIVENAKTQEAQEVTTPKDENETPRDEITTTKEDATPEKDDVAPKKEDVAPKEEDAAPKEEAAAPKEEAAAPKEEAAVPKEEVAVPKEEVAVPKEEDATSQKNNDAKEPIILLPTSATPASEAPASATPASEPVAAE
ncbi:expressed unknown protein [Seminavis robusta]|uniref:Uncharacterized protein n=1 Tax=Seminavis robusta TaxID=568900 RepID=A0A9N8D6M4_9STRA|nr:expressed unknown protein [Seminavis robusta]|eukprot:Sro2_g001610.1 n/a (468) ;mRNA; r:202049-203452